ncbi:MAG: hypothetical protein ABIP17_08945 [Ilumatobacteraceae bacterium]
MTLPMLVIVALVVAVVVAAAAVAAIVISRGRTSRSIASQPAPPPKRVRPADVPMTGLESALAAVTDREGRPIRDRIDAESGHVDELRVPDDTGPLLRRALDHVSHESTDPTPNSSPEWPEPPAPDVGVPDVGALDERDLGPTG